MLHAPRASVVHFSRAQAGQFWRAPKLLIEWLGDTNGATGGSSYWNNYAPAGTVSVTISGLGTATFTGYLRVFTAGTGGSAGFANATGPTILGTSSAVFAAYDLKAAIGPISDRHIIEPAFFIETNRGDLNIRIAGDSTFTAITTAVPDPGSTLLLLAMSVTGLVAARRRWR